MTTKTNMTAIRRIRVVLSVTLLMLAGLKVFAADGTWVARQGVGTGGTDWTEWSDSANWSGGIVASNGNANLTAAAAQYIRLPDTLTVTNFGAAGSSVFVGDGTYTFVPRKGANSPQACHLYCPFALSLASDTVYYGFADALNICGAITAMSGTPLCSGAIRFRYDLFADAAGEDRVLSARGVNANGGSHLYFIAPHGSSTNMTSRWVQTAGSPFLRLADGESPHVLSAGTAVSGDGIPEGAFLKRIFPDGSIELSAAPTVSAAANSLTFAAFNARTEVQMDGTISAFNTASARYVSVQKYRAEDDFTLTLSAISFAFVGSNADLNKFYISTDPGYLPGRIRIKSMSGSAAAPCKIHLENCHLEIAADNKYYAYSYAMVESAAHTARLTVTNGMTRKFARLSRLAGTMVKDGAGTLEMEMPSDTAANVTGAIVVEEGTFAPTFAESGTNAIGSLTVRSGARFVIPEGVVLVVGSISVEEGAIFGGNGRLVSSGLSDEAILGLVLEDGVSISDGRQDGDFKVDVVRGHAEMAIVDDDGIFVFDTNSLIRVNGTGVLDVLVVGGGGGGGYKGGGGGGGGGVVYTQQMAVACGVYSLAVGNGGKGGQSNTIYSTGGGDSSVFGLVARGGGAGGTYASANGKDGSSGGGGGTRYPWSSTDTMPGGSGVPGQGHDGGKGCNINYASYGEPPAYTEAGSSMRSTGGGGGGAGSAGTDASYDSTVDRVKGGKGGDGVLCEIYGSKCYGGGGGGGTSTYRASATEDFCGGVGGGGNGGVTSSVEADGESGTDGLGGGGGGGGCGTLVSVDHGGKGGDGGRGVVILRWRRAVPTVRPVDGEVAEGGSVRRRSGYAVHTFTNDGAFVLSQPTYVDLLLVAGGGGGGALAGGGGGGGGVVVVSNVYLESGSYPVIVGKGGAGAPGSNKMGSNGEDTTFCFHNLTVTAIGGGGGGTLGNGGAGGSGGGAGAPYFTSEAGSSHNGGLGDGFQGNSGGSSYLATAGSWFAERGGGGGGAGASGGDATSGAPGNGGDGVYCDFSGMSVCYGGGGGGGMGGYNNTPPHYASSGGDGGGGRGAACNLLDGNPILIAGEDGTDGRGGGGGGASGYTSSSETGGNGGSGVVIIRYRIPKPGFILKFY